MKSLAKMEKRLKELEKAITLTEARLPARSVKPPVMEDLPALEDEYASLMHQIRSRKSVNRDGICNGCPTSMKV
jgi:hypothetical protein